MLGDVTSITNSEHRCGFENESAETGLGHFEAVIALRQQSETKCATRVGGGVVRLIRFSYLGYLELIRVVNLPNHYLCDEFDRVKGGRFFVERNSRDRIEV